MTLTVSTRIACYFACQQTRPRDTGPCRGAQFHDRLGVEEFVVANEKHVKIVYRGPEAVRAWKEKNQHRWLDLHQANLINLDLARINLRGTNLQGANLHRSILSEADLMWANLSEATLTDACLTDAGLDQANLYEARLQWADLTGASLRGAMLRRADLSKADLIRTKLNHATLLLARLTGADLRGADLSGTDLREADLSDADLRGVNLRGAVCWRTKFANVDLSSVKGLETVEHWGPSSVGVDTLYQSWGKIPEVFLRGCGVPDGLISSLPSLVAAEETGFYCAFIGYDPHDREFFKRLTARLRAAHLRVWYNPQVMDSAYLIGEELDEVMGIFGKLLLVLSKNSLGNDSVNREICEAYQRGINEKRRFLFPIRLVNLDAIREWQCIDAGTGKDVAHEIRKYCIPDFSKWKNKSDFEEAFARLLKYLRAETSVGGKKS
jgi:uncharacterized protein YjbI with pentapeptide repeats